MASIEGRSYFSCDTCQARFLSPCHHPSRAAEQATYLLHENRIEDRGYRRFLGRLAEPLIERLRPGARGLDYGCGPGPALAAMLREAGHEVELYDPFFHPDRSVLGVTYDFVTCTEVLEHLHRPAPELDRLTALVRPRGVLAIMTCFQTDDETFAGWHYRKDPTHVVFYREATFHWLAAKYGWRCDVPRKDVVFLHRPDGRAEGRLTT